MTKAEVYKIIEDYYRKNFKKLVNIYRYKTGTYHNSEDTVQEAFTRALTYWDSYSPDDEFSKWFTTILDNCAHNLNAENRLKGMVGNALANEIDIPISDSPYFKIFLNDIKKDVEAMPKGRDKDIIRLIFFNSYTPVDISKVYGMSQGAVRSLVSRHREEVRWKYGKGLHS